MVEGNVEFGGELTFDENDFGLLFVGESSATLSGPFSTSVTWGMQGDAGLSTLYIGQSSLSGTIIFGGMRFFFLNNAACVPDDRLLWLTELIE